MVGNYLAFWIAHMVLALPLTLPIVWFARRRVDWRRWELLVFVLPFCTWGLLVLAEFHKKSDGNFVYEFSALGFSVPVAALLRAAIGAKFSQPLVAAILIGMACLLIAGVYFFLPLLPD
jgi:hypothetical protein